jgi:hypothetical protein
VIIVDLNNEFAGEKMANKASEEKGDGPAKIQVHTLKRRRRQ